jgi:RimJ/RimL family protein N-acetyltransferase
MADIEGARHCVDVVARERAYLSFLQAPPLEDSMAFWSSLIEKAYPFMLAVDDKTVVGWCDVRPELRPIFSHVGTLGMGLLPAYRGVGIGARLMQAALSASRACGLERVELAVFAENLRAQRLYQRMGFVAEGRRPRRIKIDGRYQDEILMGRDLA